MHADKCVIFVGGTSFSGSTLTDMILANDPGGISCGEVYAIFYPFRRHHLHLEQLSQAFDWREMRESGPKNLYTNIFNRFPDCRFIVDSSKSPLWISERSSELRALGVRVEHVLVWKTPSEFRASCEKRGRERGWRREWVNYHRYYFTLIEGWRSIPYRDLVTDSDVLPRICSSLRIPYFPGKEQYWNNVQHTVFGNDTTRIHLHDQSSDQYASVRSAIASDIEETKLPHHRTLSYSAIPSDATGEDDDERFGRIIDVLERFDVRKEGSARIDADSGNESLRMGRVFHAFQIAKLKYRLGWIVDAVRS